MYLRSMALLLCLGLVTAAVAQEDADRSAIFVMKPDGSGLRKIVEVEGYSDHSSPRWSHDGKRLVFDAKSQDGGEWVCFVVGVDGNGLRELVHGQFAEWSPDDLQIAYQYKDDGGSGIYVQNLDGQGRVKITEGRSPRWSPDGSLLLYSDRRMLRAIDLITGEEKVLLPVAMGIVDGFAWSPEGKQVAVVVRPSREARRQLLFVDPADSEADLAPRLESAMGGSVSYSPDGKQLVFSQGWKIQKVDVDGDAKPSKIAGQEDKNWHPAFSPDGKWIAFASSRRLPDSSPPKTAATGREKVLKEVRRHDKRTVVWSLDFTPDGRKVVLGGAGDFGSGVQVWDVTTGDTHDLGGDGMLICVCPDGRRFVTSFVRPSVQLIDITSGELLREFDNGNRIWAFNLSRDGRKLLTGGLDKIIRIWDVESGDVLATFDPQPDYILRATFTPDGKEVLCARHDQTLAVFDTETGKQRLSIEHPQPAAVWGLAVSPDGRYFFTGTGGVLSGSLTGLNLAEGNDNVLRMWDRESGALVREMKGHEEGVFCVDVSPDGRLAVTGSSDGTMRLWDVSTGQEVSKIGPGKGIVACVRFSPDGKLIVAGGGISRISGQVIEFPSEQVRVYKVLDADDKQAAAATEK